MDSDAYLRVGSSEFISMHHCLVRLACVQMHQGVDSLHRTFRLTTSADGVPSGEYVLGVIELEVSGIRPRVELRPIAIRVGASEPLPIEMSKRLFIGSLEQAHSWEAPAVSNRNALSLAVALLRKEADRERARLKDTESTLGGLRAARRRATQEGTLRQRLKAAKDRLAKLRSQGAGEFPIRMASRKLQIEQARLDEFSAGTEPDVAAVISPRDLAVVLVSVELK
jgi:hypothetical protein